MNKISLSEFGQLLSEFLPGATCVPSNTTTLDTAGFNVNGLARFLGEPLALVNTLILKKVSLGSRLGALCSSKYSPDFNFKDLRFCPFCLANGYHSNLHQADWMDKCFIHGSLLENSYDHGPSLRNLGEETRLIQPLYVRWFKSEKLRSKADVTWPEAKCPVWTFDNRKHIQQAAQRVIFKLRDVEKRLAATEHPPPRLIGGPIGARVVMAMNMIGMRNKSIFNLLIKEKLSFKHTRHFICNREEAAAILDLDAHDLSLLIHSRQVMCAISELRPQWKSALEELEQSLVSGHEACLELLHESTLSGEMVRLGYTNYYVQAPFDRELFHSVPCDRIVTLNFLQDLQDIEEENPFSHMPVAELSMIRNRWGLLASLGLMSQASGFIPRDGHRLFGSNNQNLGAKGSNAEGVRRCQLLAPSGVLAQVIDEMILAHVWSWCWALFSMERQARNLFDPRNYPQDFLRREVSRLSPLFGVHQDASGLAVKTGTHVPFKPPSWKTCLGNKLKHAQEVADMYNFLIDRFDRDRSKVWDEVNRHQTITMRAIRHWISKTK